MNQEPPGLCCEIDYSAVLITYKIINVLARLHTVVYDMSTVPVASYKNVVSGKPVNPHYKNRKPAAGYAMLCIALTRYTIISLS